VEHSTVTETHREVTLTGLKGLLTGQRRRVLREYLTGYLMILPSTALVFLFGIFPVAFALYVSMQKWRLKRGDFIGMDNFVRALGNLAYILFFLIAISALVGAVILFRRIRGQAVENEERPWLLTIPAVFHAAAVLALFRWLILLLPEVLDIAGKIIGVEKSRELFVSLLGEAFRVETVLGAFQVFIVLTLISLITGFITSRLWKNPRNLIYQSQFAFVWLTASIGVLLLVFTYQEVAKAYQLALETGTDPGIWPQVITIGSGILLLVLAWIVWRSAEGQSSNRSFWLRLFAALFLLVAGWVLIAEIPIVMAAGDDDVWQGLKVTIFYSLGTVPFQLGISLFLAILLFQKLTGSGLFRMLFFLPYVTPFVASAVVFRQMFSIRPQAPVNQFIGLFGVESLAWIQEPDGIISMLGSSLGYEVPDWAAGPSLALVVIMFFSIWVFVGYNTVIYLAGLGNISLELIDAAQIDGAGRWGVFRNIIFPLLSPTTYFLSLIAIIGTFKAFSHIWVMRHELALGATDTFSVFIFAEFFDKVRFGYASALAFVLFAVILSLTFINNRIQGSRVFYG
jgi:multiple sugar transport system permease protein